MNWITRILLVSTLIVAAAACARDTGSDEPGPAIPELFALRTLTFSLHNFRYCEVLLAKTETGGIRAEVYNTMTLNSCPQEQWDALDAATIASEFGFENAILNGPRFWVLDGITLNNPGRARGPLARFGEIEMYRVASVLLPGLEKPYEVNRVTRDTTFHYRAGREVYELEDPAGRKFIMQSFSRIQDKELTLGELADLGNRLTLPAGWKFTSRVLDASFFLSTSDGLAEVVADGLGNAYQRIP